MQDVVDANVDENSPVVSGADAADDEVDPVPDALLVQLCAELKADAPVYKIVRLCNELRSTLAEALALHLPDSMARIGVVSADDPSAVVFNVTCEQFSSIAAGHPLLIYSYTEIPSNIRVLSDDQLTAAAKKPAKYLRGLRLGSAQPFFTGDDDESDDFPSKHPFPPASDFDEDDD